MNTSWANITMWIIVKRGDEIMDLDCCYPRFIQLTLDGSYMCHFNFERFVLQILAGFFVRLFGRTGARKSTNRIRMSKATASRGVLEIVSMSESSQPSPSPSTTPPSSVPSPALSTLSLSDLKEVTESDRQEATKLKADANKAFVCMLGRYSRIGCPLTSSSTLPEKLATFREPRNCTPKQ
jgi:hypothetical protein